MYLYSNDSIENFSSSFLKSSILEKDLEGISNLNKTLLSNHLIK